MKRTVTILTVLLTLVACLLILSMDLYSQTTITKSGEQDVARRARRSSRTENNFNAARSANVGSSSSGSAGTLFEIMANFTDTFASAPFTGYPTSFTTGTAATGLSYVAANADFAYSAGNQNVNALAIVFPGAASITITSRDGKAFVFNSIYLDNLEDVVIVGNGPEPFTINVSAGTGTYSPAGGSKLVTSVVIESAPPHPDFDTTFDNVNVELDVPGMEVQGNGTTIVNGDNTPAAGDHTDFGTTPSGTPVSRTFTIRSIGDQNLDLTGSPYVTLSGSGDFSVTSQPTTDPIASGGSDTFTVQCDPSSTGIRTTTVSIANDSEANPYTFDVQCTGTTPPPPNVTFTNGANAALNFTQSNPSPPQNDWPLGQFRLAGDASGATLNSVAVTLGGTYDAGDLGSNPFRLFASNTNNFSGASEIGSDVADPGSGSDVTFGSLSDAVPSGTRYYWVTADISASATVDDNINGTVDAAGDLSISDGTLSGSSNYGKLSAGDDVPLPVELAAFSVICTSEGVLIEWATESETNNLGYILDRKLAGECVWTTIASYQTHDALKGAGNTSSRTEYAFTDVNVFAGETYCYRLSVVDFGYTVTIKDVIEITVTETFIPEITELEPAFPNPFNPDTKIGYKLSEDAEVTLKVVDLRGRTVLHILNGEFQQAGSYSYYWHGKNDQEQPTSSGVYLLVLKAGSVVKTQKVMLVR